MQRTLVQDGNGGTHAGAEPVEQPEGRQDGSAVYIPLLQRCRARIACQAARLPQTELPQIKLQLGVSWSCPPAIAQSIMPAVPSPGLDLVCCQP